MFGIASAVQALTRTDSWQSTLGSFGDRRDRGRTDTMRLRPNAVLDDYTLTTAYKDLWLVRRVVQGLAEDALRCGWGAPETEKLENFTHLNTATHEEGAFERALHMAALKGGALLFIGYKNSGLAPQNLLEPAPQGAEVAFLEVFDRFQLQGEARVQEVDSPEYDRPQVWHVIGQRRPGLRFHASRAIRFPGLPRGQSGESGETQQDRDWGYSMLQPIWADVVRYGVFWQSVGHLMQLSSVGVLTLKGIIQMLASKNKDIAEARIDLLNQHMSSTRVMVLDADGAESYHREAVSFSDMPALLQELQVATAGALGRPVTKLFGRSPAGMNATGESDLRNYYDEVQSYRTRIIEPRLEQVLEICEGKKIDVEFESLWQPTDKEVAEIRNLQITGTERLWAMGVASDAEIRAAMKDGKLVEETVSGPPPAEPARPVATVAVVQPGENPAKSDSIDWHEDVDVDAVERRLAARAVSGLLEDPDALGDIAGPDPVAAERAIKAHLVSKAKDMLPAKADVPKAKQGRVSEMKKLKTFRAEVEARVPELAKKGAEIYAENERRSREALIDDPDHVQSARLPGDTNGAATYLENKRREKAGLPLITGPRGGRYYVSVGGSKTYVK